MSLQSYLTLCDPIKPCHFSRIWLCEPPPGSPVPGILQARTLEWVAISFSNAWKWKVKVKSLSHVRLLETPWTAAYQAPPPMGFSRQEYWSGVPLPSLAHIIQLVKIDQKKMENNNGQNIRFIGRTDVEAETPILWPPDAKSWLIWKDPDAGKDWRQEEKGTTEDEMFGWHHWLSGRVWVNSGSWWSTGRPGVL